MSLKFYIHIVFFSVATARKKTQKRRMELKLFSGYSVMPAIIGFTKFVH